MVHHNPNAGTSKGGLTETEPFLELLRARRHVKAWFFGHSHRWSVTEDQSGLHLINLPATSYPFDKEQPTGWVMARLEREGLRLELSRSTVSTRRTVRSKCCAGGAEAACGGLRRSAVGLGAQSCAQRSAAVGRGRLTLPRALWVLRFRA
jgi:hypothetical protein